MMLSERLLEIEGGCLVWQGARNSGGYGTVRYQGRMRVVHHVAWEQVHGPVPPGHQLHHRCERKACANVEHLKLVTPKTHVLEHGGTPLGRKNKAKTHCPKGHRYSPENTKVYKGKRYCRCCVDAASLAWHRRRR